MGQGGQSNGSVLVVDDDHAVRMILSDLLEDEGYAVGTAADGEEALDCLRDRPFDLLITDLAMPRLDGHELIDKVAVSYPDLAVIAMTAEPSTDAIQASFDGGVQTFLVKPFDSLEEVVDKVRRMLLTARLRSRISGGLEAVRQMLEDEGGEPR